MRTFVRVVEKGSLSAAARAERASLPLVSRRLRALEEELGATLLVRSTRRLRVTDAGRRYYEHCVRILREVDAARDDVAEGDAARGTLVVSASITIGLSLVIPRLAALARSHPGLSVDLRIEDRFVDLVGEGVDVAVRGGTPPPDSTAFVAHQLRRADRIVVGSPAYLRAHGVPRAPEDLARHACLVQLGGAGSVVRWTFTRDGVERTVDVRGAVRTNAPVALRDLARAGLGLALVTDWTVADDLASGALRRVLAGWAHPPVSIWALYRAEARGSPRVRAFVDAMRA
ncbi:MAG: LysR substrate-binding domain-containing protein [Minicystis sp.]